MSSTIFRRGLLQLGRRRIDLSAATGIQRTSPPAAASSVLRAWFSSYPPHEVVGLPALSPVRFQLNIYYIYIYIYIYYTTRGHSFFMNFYHFYFVIGVLCFVLTVKKLFSHRTNFYFIL
jgi:hypothetical protein